ncbi:MAG: glycoside hydrolase family 2 TIM barrel-domain containing protein [Rikenellaceae bacterium]
MKMRLATLFAALLTLPATLLAQSGTEWKDPQVNQINREPMRSSFFAFQSAEDAQKGCPKSSQNYLSLNGDWRFNWVENLEERPTDFFKADYLDQHWATMPVPGLWELHGYGDPLYVNIGYAWRNQYTNTPPHVPTKLNHVGSYRRHITIPEQWKGQDIFAHFGSVTSNIYLWINGKFVGYSEDSKLEAEFNITKYLKSGENLFAFQVFRWCDGTYLEDQDFFRLSGVGRDCYLYARNTSRIEDIRITPDLDSNYQDGWLDVDVKIKGKGEANLQLTDQSGHIVAQCTTTKGAAKIELENPKKWSSEQPNLYTLTTDYNGERIQTKVGFRKVELNEQSGQMLINGKPILIKGVNRHELNPDKGYYVSREDMLRDIKVFKELNINAVRTCHYPNQNEWYELCDQYGIYVVAEANLESHGMGYGDATLAKVEAFQKAHLERNMRNVQRGFNHPSIIIWSLGNEGGDGENFDVCYDWIKAEDPSRLVQYERAADARNSHTDIHCPMYYPYEDCQEYALSDAPRPLIQCEYAHAMGNSMGGFKEYWEMIRKYPKYQGGFIWDFADQSLRWKDDQGREIWAYGGDFNPYDATDNNFCNNGVVDPDRNPNPHAAEVRYYHQNIWTSPVDLNRGEVEIFNENFFSSLSNYMLKWSLLSNGTVIEQGFIDNIDIAAQRRKTYTLGYTLPQDDSSELLLNVEYITKRRDGLVAAGTIAAYDQLTIAPYTFPAIDLSTIEGAAPTIEQEDIHFLRIHGDNFTIDFAKENGYITRYRVGNDEYIAKDGALRPNFWRAPTDNDLGGETLTAMRKSLVWKNPSIELNDITHSTDGNTVEVVAKYDLPDLSSSLTISYAIAPDGTIAISQEIEFAQGADIPAMLRFGMQAALSGTLSNIDYYGRGPGENYTDRKGSAMIGRYTQRVDEQYFPYIRPQESGAKCDVRSWKLLDNSGRGIEIYSEEPFIATARDYSQASLDDDEKKKQRHSPQIQRVDYTELSIDQSQMGLGCLNSWGARPQEQYQIPAKNYKFKFVISPVRIE